MTRRICIPVMMIAAVAACGRKGARAADFDSATAVALAPPPGTPVTPTPAPVARTIAFDMGHAVDRSGALIGGTAARFARTDTVMVSVETQYANRGDTVSVRIRSGNHTVDSAFALVPAPDSSHVAVVALPMTSAKPWAVGSYHLEVFLGATSQGTKDFTVTQQ